MRNTKVVPVKRTFIALKSLARDDNERSLFNHEYDELPRLLDLKWVRWKNWGGDYETVVLTAKGKRVAKEQGFKVYK